MWLLLILLVVFGTLGVMLSVALIRLNKELKQLGDDTESLAARLQRTTQTIQVAVPLLTLARQAGTALWKKREQLMKKGEK